MTSMSQLENNTIIITVITVRCKVEVERIKNRIYRQNVSMYIWQRSKIIIVMVVVRIYTTIWKCCN